MGYEILLTAIFNIGLCNKFQDQSSVNGLSRQLVEFKKAREKHKILKTFVCIGMLDCQKDVRDRHE